MLRYVKLRGGAQSRQSGEGWRGKIGGRCENLQGTILNFLQFSTLSDPDSFLLVVLMVVVRDFLFFLKFPYTRESVASKCNRVHWVMRLQMSFPPGLLWINLHK
jgi:hypothetical protein